VYVCVVYYSKSGKTEKVAKYVAERISSLGFNVSTFFIRPSKDYFDRFLHLNPRVIYEILSGRTVEIVGDEGFDSATCGALVIATPVWYGTATPPILSFLSKYSGRCSSPVYVLTTSDLRVDYASKLKELAERKGFNVRGYLSVVSLESDLERVNDFVDRVAADLRGTSLGFSYPRYLRRLPIVTALRRSPRPQHCPRPPGGSQIVACRCYRP